jgi:hypothetical protein
MVTPTKNNTNSDRVSDNKTTIVEHNNTDIIPSINDLGS